MKIREVMDKPIFISPESNRSQILSIVKKHPKTVLFIVADNERKFLGDIHENDLFYMLIPDEQYEDIGIELAFDLQKKFFAKTAKEIMRKHDVNCKQDDDIQDAMMKFAQEEVNEMPVLDKDEKVVGVINQGILLRCIKL